MPVACVTATPNVRGETNERRFEYSFGNWKGEQANSHIHVRTVKCTLYMYMAVQFLDPHPTLQKMYFEIQHSSTTCHADRSIVPHAQHRTNKLLITMH